MHTDPAQRSESLDCRRPRPFPHHPSPQFPAGLSVRVSQGSPEKAMAPHSSTLAWKILDRGAWWAAVHGVAKSWTWLSSFTFTFHFHALEKEKATHSSVLASRIPGTKKKKKRIPGMGEPGGLLSMGSHRVRHDWSDLAAAAAGLTAYRPTMVFLWPLYFLKLDLGLKAWLFRSWIFLTRIRERWCYITWERRWEIGSYQQTRCPWNSGGGQECCSVLQKWGVMDINSACPLPWFLSFQLQPTLSQTCLVVSTLADGTVSETKPGLENGVICYQGNPLGLQSKKRNRFW